MTAGKTGNGNTTASRHLYSIEYDDGDGTLTPLQGQANIDLFRSLSFGGIVAFVGSGTSYLLGYGTWKDLADNLVKVAGEGIHSSSKPSLERLRIALGEINAEDSTVDKYDRLALATEILRQLGSSEDEIAAACERSLMDTYRDAFGFKTPREKEKSIESLNRLRGINGLESIADSFKSQAEARGGRFLPVDYGPGVILIETLFAADPNCTESSKSEHKAILNKSQLLGMPAPSVDVLGTLRREWKISRYATLNYDYEIERMLERADFPFYSITPRENNNSHQLISRSRLGEKARSVDLDPKNVAELMLFAADAPAGVSQVLHLHGSVLRPENMIVTDLDYNRRYFTTATWTSVLDDSQELLYRGNAIVFVGVGMTEEVLFRAMRILSQAPDREARPVYAFMQSTGGAKDTADAIRLFQRYGIRTIFYGTSLVPDPDPEMVDFRRHPLVLDAVEHNKKSLNAKRVDPEESKRHTDPEEIASRIKSLSFELNFLNKLEKVLGNDGVNTANFNELRNEVKEWVLPSGKVHIESQNVPERCGDQWFGNEFIIPNFDCTFLPRLSLTPWHSTVFSLLWKIISAKADGNSFITAEAPNATETMRALSAAIVSLKTAINSRALQDSLQAIALKAQDWRERWKTIPKTQNQDLSSTPYFRRPDNILSDQRVIAHNIAKMPNVDALNSELLRAILRDVNGKEAIIAILERMQSRLVILQAKSGMGKGMLASRLAYESDDLASGVVRIVLSFGQSCGRDPVFDLLRQLCEMHNNNSDIQQIQVVLTRTDVVLALSERRPRLAEWEAFLKDVLLNNKVSILILCENEESKEFFHELSKGSSKSEIKQHAESRLPKAACQPWLDSFKRVDSLGSELNYVLEVVYDIVKFCESVWAASFLTAILAQVALSRSRVLDSRIGRAGRLKVAEKMLRSIQHAVHQVQDPRQRVPTAIDTAIAQIEYHALAHLDTVDRLRKVISHAILKHLFAFGGPVEITVFLVCPEIRKIQSDYADILENLKEEIASAIKWLSQLHMITTLVDCFSGNERYGLHSHVRNWLATKKGLPFSVVAGREQTAITVIPIIDEEIVPLDQEDYDFIWHTFDGVLTPQTDENGLHPSHIRAAFMLLRGSMRIGTVLRSAHEKQHGRSSVHTPLDEYFRRLLAIRHASIRCAASCPCGDDPRWAAPLFEREWVWLFNEMGVVKLLEGHAHDATIFFEEAIEFERDRLRRKNGFEASVYAKEPHADFSITKLRIMMNMALAEIERGAFNRARRILNSANRDIDSVGHKFRRPKTNSRNSRSPQRRKEPEKGMHREIRILNLVQGLITARLEYLSGGSSAAITWLLSNRDQIYSESVHGLTSLYCLILGDVYLRRKNQQRCMELFATARAEAEASGRSDLVFSVMLAESERQMESHLRDDASDLQQHLSRIRKIKDQAKKMGMMRIVVTASMIRARLYLGFGEYRSAREDLMTALTFSTANGLNIKRVSALIDMAALVASRDPELRSEAKDMAEAARFDAERMGYKLAAARAKDLELVLRDRGSIEDWVFRRGSDAQDAGKVDD